MYIILILCTLPVVFFMQKVFFELPNTVANGVLMNNHHTADWLNIDVSWC